MLLRRLRGFVFRTRPGNGRSAMAPRDAGYTLVEIMLGISLFMLLLMAVYRLFFAQVRSIQASLEQIGVNENIRLFLARFGNDIRNASFLTEPTPTVREGVPLLLPAIAGEVFCAMEQQVFDFAVKPPDPQFIRTIKIAYRLQKAKDGTFEVIREVQSNQRGPAKVSRKLCGGLKEIVVFSEIKRPVTLSAFAIPGLKSFLNYEPYETDGTSPALVHVRAVFIRPERPDRPKPKNPNVEIRTCFAMRGRPSYPNP